MVRCKALDLTIFIESFCHRFRQLAGTKNQKSDRVGPWLLDCGGKRSATPLCQAEGDSLDELKRGEGKILRLNGKKVAAHRDQAGNVTLSSPVCTHLGCIVRWNNAGQTWDCPCHGSRFHPDGRAFSGPAESPLAKNPSGK